MIDMFNETSRENNEDFIYETQILDDDANGQKVTVQSDSIGEYVLMEISIKNGSAYEV